MSLAINGQIKGHLSLSGLDSKVIAHDGVQLVPCIMDKYDSAQSQ